MKITPLEIQQMVFKVRVRGYAREEVDQFLDDLAKTFETLNRENADLRGKLSDLEKQFSDVKKAETALSNTLISAQALGEELKQAAQRDAELIIKEAELQASEMLRGARAELVDTQRDLVEIRKQRLLMIERLRSTLRTFERTIEIEQEVDNDHSESADPAERLARDSNL